MMSTIPRTNEIEMTIDKTKYQREKWRRGRRIEESRREWGGLGRNDINISKMRNRIEW